MTNNVKKKARLLIAGMGTVLTVAPSVAIERMTVTPSHRLANATNRVGMYFRAVMAKDVAETSERKKPKAA